MSDEVKLERVRTLLHSCCGLPFDSDELIAKRRGAGSKGPRFTSGGTA